MSLITLFFFFCLRSQFVRLHRWECALSSRQRLARIGLWTFAKVCVQCIYSNNWMLIHSLWRGFLVIVTIFFFFSLTSFFSPLYKVKGNSIFFYNLHIASHHLKWAVTFTWEKHGLAAFPLLSCYAHHSHPFFFFSLSSQLIVYFFQLADICLLRIPWWNHIPRSCITCRDIISSSEINSGRISCESHR